MYAAFNTLQLELERLLLLKQSMEDSSNVSNYPDYVNKLAELDNKIRSHEKAIKVLNQVHQAAIRTANVQVLKSS